jgi:hypothetical protein
VIRRLRVKFPHLVIFSIVSIEKLSLSVGFLSFAGKLSDKVNSLKNFTVFQGIH